MRRPQRVARSLGALAIVALAATACATQPPGEANQDGGTGQLATVTATATTAAAPQPTADEPAPEDETPPSPPGPGGGIRVFPTLIYVPPGVLQPWPANPDCVEYDPEHLDLMSFPSGYHLVLQGPNNVILEYKRLEDAQAGKALAESYQKHCFIGRSTPLNVPDRDRYIMDYWLEPVASSALPPYVDCISHNPGNLTVESYLSGGATRWRVRSGNQLIASFYTQADAQDAVKVMKHYNQNCWIGRGYTGADRLEFITNWFRYVP